MFAASVAAVVALATAVAAVAARVPVPVALLGKLLDRLISAPRLIESGNPSLPVEGGLLVSFGYHRA